MSLKTKKALAWIVTILLAGLAVSWIISRDVNGQEIIRHYQDGTVGIKYPPVIVYECPKCGWREEYGGWRITWRPVWSITVDNRTTRHCPDCYARFIRDNVPELIERKEK